MSSRAMLERVEKGLMSEAKRQTIIERRKAAQAEAVRMMLISRYRDAHTATWDRVRASLIMAARTLRNKRGIVPVEVGMWYIQMGALLEDASNKMRERMIGEDADENWRFWYDFDAGVAAAARELVKQFPQHDEHKCPLIIL